MIPLKRHSLFGGIECGRVALNNLSITPDNYFSSEINTNSIKIASKNFLDIEHIGSVTDVKAVDLPKIDLILAGFSCTDLSRAGRQNRFYGINISEIERKSLPAIAKIVGLENEQGLHHFLTYSPMEYGYQKSRK